MSQPPSTSSLAGKAGALLALVGFAFFFGGLFGAPKYFVLVGCAVIAASLAAYYIEEIGHRKQGI